MTYYDIMQQTLREITIRELNPRHIASATIWLTHEDEVTIPAKEVPLFIRVFGDTVPIRLKMNIELFTKDWLIFYTCLMLEVEAAIQA